MAGRDQSLIILEQLPDDKNPAAILLAQAGTTNTHRAYTRCLNNIANIFECQIHELDWRLLRYQHGMMIRARLSEIYESGSTINQHLAVLRGVFVQSWLLGNMKSDEYHSIVQGLSNVQESKMTSGRYISEDTFNALLATCKDSTLLDTRDRAILMLFYFTGMRKQDLLNLNIEDFNAKTKSLTLRRAKTKEDRIVAVDGAAFRNIKRWLKRRAWENGSEPLFCSIDRKMSRLTASALDARLKSRAKEIGIASISSQDFRRTWASNNFDNQNLGDLTVVTQDDWKVPNTAYRYDQRDEEDNKRAAEFIDIPTEDD